VLVWSTATAACAFCGSFSQLMVARVCVGVGEASLVPAALSIIADHFGPKNRANAVALFICGAPLGLAGAYLLGGIFLQHERILAHVRGFIPPIHFNWQLVFIVLGFFGTLVTLPIMLIVEPPRARHSDEGKLGSDAGRGSLVNFLRRNPTVLNGLLLGPAISSIAYYALLVWGPAMVTRRFNWEPLRVAVWFTPLSLIAGVTGPWVGAWTGNVLSGTTQAAGFLRGMLILSALGAICCAAAVTVPVGGLAVAGIFIAMGLFIAALSLPQIAIQYVISGQLRGTVMALWVFGANIIGFGVGPLIVAAITDYLFHSDSRLNVSLGVVCMVATIAGGLLTAAQLKGYRDCVVVSSMGQRLTGEASPTQT
jgi:MFS family permease